MNGSHLLKDVPIARVSPVEFKTSFVLGLGLYSVGPTGLGIFQGRYAQGSAHCPNPIQVCGIAVTRQLTNTSGARFEVLPDEKSAQHNYLSS
jgi:hypothetical protein